MAKRMKEKAARIAATKDRRPRAVAKYIRMSPHKVRIALDLIRNTSYNEAVAILENIPQIAAEPILKALKSAGANAEHNLHMNKADLKVAACYADQGPTAKRIQPMSKGRAYHILKRSSHITVVLDAAK